MIDVVAFIVGVAIQLGLCSWSPLPPPKPSPLEEPRICPQRRNLCFSYDRKSVIGPGSWDLVCDTQSCFGGSNQSPIRINPDRVKYYCDPVNILQYNALESVTGILENDGIFPMWAGGIFPVWAGGNLDKVFLQGVPGCLDTKFRLMSVHVHVGKPGRAGNEHVVGGKKYDAELHLINARDGPAGINRVAGTADVGIFLSRTEGETNFELDKLLSRLDEIQTYTGAVTCWDKPCYQGAGRHSRPSCPPWDSGYGRCGGVGVTIVPELLLPFSRDFYYYYGSRTIPTLSENALWMIMMEPMRITQTQMDLIRSMETRFPGVRIGDNGNSRSPQPLQGRKVLANCCSKSKLN
ncbi:carbonic anhydrase 13-like [Haliotis cracherodii]|uniref:carbonic anhydrase 13-like n=1 Tax=Haliotis cracherodii TaxID=6455 RepID=UPI0039EBD34B